MTWLDVLAICGILAHIAVLVVVAYRIGHINGRLDEIKRRARRLDDHA